MGNCQDSEIAEKNGVAYGAENMFAFSKICEKDGICEGDLERLC